MLKTGFKFNSDLTAYKGMFFSQILMISILVSLTTIDYIGNTYFVLYLDSYLSFITDLWGTEYSFYKWGSWDTEKSSNILNPTGLEPEFKLNVIL
jgi:hypothetical protein